MVVLLYSVLHNMVVLEAPSRRPGHISICQYINMSICQYVNIILSLSFSLSLCIFFSLSLSLSRYSYILSLSHPTLWQQKHIPKENHSEHVPKDWHHILHVPTLLFLKDCADKIRLVMSGSVEP